MRRAAKVDDNQAKIVQALRDCGCSVQSLAAVGNGVPDLLVSRGGITFVMEVKDGKKPPSKRCLTPAQQEWVRNWQGIVHIVESVDDAIGILKYCRP